MTCPDEQLWSPRCAALLRTPELQAMIGFVRDRLSSPAAHVELNRFYFRDRYTHILRVVGWVARLLKELPGDEYAILVASIFHDSGYDYSNPREHARASAIICREYLSRIGLDEGMMDKIVEMVASHSHKEISAYALSMDLQILMDADLLDELGLTIMLWDSMGEGSRQQGNYYTAFNRIQYAYEKLTHVRRSIKTSVGRRYYDEGLEFLNGAIKRLEFELQPGLLDMFEGDGNGQ